MEEMSNFIKTIMENDLKEKKVTEIITRFPPEPNAYLHIGHARALVMNFELAKHFNGYTNLRFDDTNPVNEDVRFVDAIQEDIKWLGYTPQQVLFGSDYFEQTYEKAVLLIQKGLAYVCDLTQEEMTQYRGTLTEAGKESPYRNRTVEENLALFTKMRDGKFKDGEKVLRAKIDMASSNMNMRDPVLYRIIHIDHHQTSNDWCIYPMYDFAHPLQDAFEGVTHSLCSLEYDNHRPLYDWVVANCDTEHTPHQYEFGRLNITNTIMSKRYLRQLVESHKVVGYDDPRMPTLVGLKRRGVRPEAIKTFIVSTGLSRINSTVDGEMFDHFIREDLKEITPRVMAIIDPLKVVITNYEEDKVEYMEVPLHPEDESMGTKQVAFSKYLYIEKEDFVLEKPNKHYKRLALGQEVRLFHAFFIACHDVVYDALGNIQEIHCTYDPLTKSGSGFTGRKPNGTIHFVEATTAIPAEFNLFEPLILSDSKNKQELLESINPNSWIKQNGFVEKLDTKWNELDRFQFLRHGYFAVDKESREDKLVFNRIVSLKSSFKG